MRAFGGFNLFGRVGIIPFKLRLPVRIPDLPVLRKFLFARCTDAFVEGSVWPLNAGQVISSKKTFFECPLLILTEVVILARLQLLITLEQDPSHQRNLLRIEK